MSPLHYGQREGRAMSKHTIAIGALLVVGCAAGLGYILYQPPSPRPPDLTHVPAKCQPLMAVLETLERTCLSDQGGQAEAKVQAKLSDVKKALSVEVGGKIDWQRVSGALGFLDEEIKADQSNNIRDCLGDYRKAILQCVAPQADTFPPSLGYSFTLKFANPDDPVLDPHLLKFGLLKPPRSQQEQLIYGSGGHYHEDIVSPKPKNKIISMVSRVVRDSVSMPAGRRLPYTSLCFERAAQMPNMNASREVKFICDEGGACAFSDYDQGWMQFCDPAHAARQNSPSTPFAAFSLSPIAAAHAQTGEDIYWRSPSLYTLEKRQDIKGVGYTRFTISAAPMPDIDADGVYFDLWVNDARVYVDGLEGRFQSVPYAPDKSLALDFALQTLDLRGLQGGCDTIRVVLTFVKDGEPTLAPITLVRTYVALRDAARETVRGGADATRHFDWFGTYVRPTDAYENEVFAISYEAKTWEDAKDVAAKRRDAARGQDAFAKLGLTFEDKPLRFVIRPPLTKPSYGAAVAVLEPTGQYRFTYGYREAVRLRTFLEEQWRASPAVRKLIDKAPFIYGANKETENPPVCDDVAKTLMLISARQ